MLGSTTLRAGLAPTECAAGQQPVECKLDCLSGCSGERCGGFLLPEIPESRGRACPLLGARQCGQSIPATCERQICRRRPGARRSVPLAFRNDRSGTNASPRKERALGIGLELRDQSSPGADEQPHWFPDAGRFGGGGVREYRFGLAGEAGARVGLGPRCQRCRIFRRRFQRARRWTDPGLELGSGKFG
jgi:hypothetical protein